jgi:hypothetical protein
MIITGRKKMLKNPHRFDFNTGIGEGLYQMTPFCINLSGCTPDGSIISMPFLS